jgi:hypothetical protein
MHVTKHACFMHVFTCMSDFKGPHIPGLEVLSDNASFKDGRLINNRNFGCRFAQILDRDPLFSDFIPKRIAIGGRIKNRIEIISSPKNLDKFNTVTFTILCRDRHRPIAVQSLFFGTQSPSGPLAS